MSNARHTAAVARALSEPAHLRKLLAAQGQRGRAASALDAPRLADFAGFITKVQHNFLWEHFPLTVLGLRNAGVELEFFRAYFLEARAPRAVGARTLEDKIRNVARFMEEFLRRRRGRWLRGVADVLLHERSEWEVRTELDRGGLQAAPARLSPAEPDGQTVFLLTGPIRLARFRYEPLEACACVHRGEPVDAEPRPHWLLYWGDRAQRSVRMVELDRASVLVLGAMDGRRSLADVARSLRRRGVHADETLLAATMLSRHGLIEPRAA